MALNHYNVDLEDPQELGEYIGKYLADLIHDNDVNYPESGFGHDVDHAWDIYIEMEETDIEPKGTWALAQEVLSRESLIKARILAKETALQIIKQYPQ